MPSVALGRVLLRYAPVLVLGRLMGHYGLAAARFRYFTNGCSLGLGHTQTSAVGLIRFGGRFSYAV